MQELDESFGILPTFAEVAPERSFTTSSLPLSPDGKFQEPNFPLLKKADMNGPNAHPLVKWTKQACFGKMTKTSWNFEKSPPPLKAPELRTRSNIAIKFCVFEC